MAAKIKKTIQINKTDVLKITIHNIGGNTYYGFNVYFSFPKAEINHSSYSAFMYKTISESEKQGMKVHKQMRPIIRLRYSK